MKKILLLNTKNWNREAIYFPLGLGYLAAACDHAGIHVKCLDLNVADVEWDQIVNDIKEKEYKVVGIGGFLTQIRSTISLANFIKEKCPETLVLIGGVQVSGCEDLLVENSKADIICRGEGEQIVPQIVDAAYGDRDLSHIPSILYRKDDVIYESEIKASAVNLDDIKYPLYDAFEVEKYCTHNYHQAANVKTIDMICSRGCPYHCTYCINSKKKEAVRYRKSEDIVSEIRYLKEKYHIDDFSFGDEIFTINKKKSLAICEALKKEKITWVTSCRADGLDDNLLSAMKSSGCRMILIGFESGSNTILEEMNKRASAENYSNAIKLLRKHDIPFYSNFMTGMPNETPKTLKETENFCIENKLIYGGSFVTPFPGTKLYDDMKHKIPDKKKYIYSLEKMNFSKAPIINLTQMSTSELISRRDEVIINTTSELISEKFKFIPKYLIKKMCGFYLTIFEINNPLFSRILRPITMRIYQVFS